MPHPADIMNAQHSKDLAKLIDAARAEPPVRKIRPDGTVKGSNFQPITEVVR